MAEAVANDYREEACELRKRADALDAKAWRLACEITEGSGNDPTNVPHVAEQETTQ